MCVATALMTADTSSSSATQRIFTRAARGEMFSPALLKDVLQESNPPKSPGNRHRRKSPTVGEASAGTRTCISCQRTQKSIKTQSSWENLSLLTSRVWNLCGKSSVLHFEAWFPAEGMWEPYRLRSEKANKKALILIGFY